MNIQIDNTHLNTSGPTHNYFQLLSKHIYETCHVKFTPTTGKLGYVFIGINFSSSSPLEEFLESIAHQDGGDTNYTDSAAAFHCFNISTALEIELEVEPTAAGEFYDIHVAELFGWDSEMLDEYNAQIAKIDTKTKDIEKTIWFMINRGKDVE